MLSAASSLMRLALAGLLALAWAGSSPAAFSLDPHNPAPVGFERADGDQAILTQRLAGSVVVRWSAPDGSRAKISSGDNAQASPPAERGPPFLSQHALPAVSVAGAPDGWIIHGYQARAPPAA